MVFYVSPNGSNDGTGEKDSPFFTINHALKNAVKYTYSQIIILEGDYRETLNFNGFVHGSLNIVGERNANVRILGSNKLSFIKTIGYKNIYDAEYSYNLLSRRIIYEDGRNSKPISETERHPLQNGLLNRLPFTHITEIDSINKLDSEPGKFYYDQKNSKIYIHTTDSTDPNLNGFNYEVPLNSCTTTGIKSSLTSIHLENISFLYGYFGINLGYSGKVTRRNVKAMGMNVDGIVDNANSVVSYNDEIADCRDGVNGHWNKVTGWSKNSPREGKSLHVYFGTWAHDNTDDGKSHHERGNVQTWGCLFEYNQKSGIAPSNSCQWVDHNSIIRNNKGNKLYGEGVEIINSIGSDSQSFGVCFIGFGTICEGNRIGFKTSSQDSNRIILYDCVSRNNDDAEYNAVYGIIELNNCRVSNSDPNKIKVISGTGKIIVKNDNLIN